jgi:hypothetical protein
MAVAFVRPVVFIAPSHQAAEVWIREWGLDSREVKIATRMQDVVGYAPGGVTFYVCGPNRPDWRWREWEDMLEYLSARGFEIIDAQHVNVPGNREYPAGTGWLGVPHQWSYPSLQ